MLYTGNRRNFFLFVSLLLVFAMLLLIATPVKAEPIGIGLTILAAIAFSALSAWGITTVTVNLQGQDLIDYMGGKLQEWANSVGSSINALFPSSGISMNPLGGFILDPIAGSNMSAFAKWFAQNEGITEGGTVADVITTGMPLYETETERTEITGNNLEGLIYVGHGLNERDNSWLRLYAKLYGITGKEYTIVRVQEKYVCCISYDDISSLKLESVLAIGSETDLGSMRLSRDGTENYHKVDKNGIQVEYQYAGVYDLRWPGVENYGSFEDAIDAFVNGENGSLTLQAPGPIAIPDDPQDDIVITIPDAIGLDVPDTADKVIQDVVDNGLDVDTDTDTGEGEGEGEGEQEKPEIEWPTLENPVGVTGLEDIFPFCIPFDIYHFFEALAATPEAPHFEIPFEVPGIVDYTFVIDLSEFNGVASILRTLETLAFVVGLALVTRKLIRG